MAEVRIKKFDENEIDTILSEDIDFQGVLTFDKPLMVKGQFRGEIKAMSDLYVGPEAVIEAKIEANLVSARGTIRGDIVAHKRVELFSSATVDGDIITPDLEMECGCRLNGNCKMVNAAAMQEYVEQ